ncbi:MAG: hypothetical protein HZB55_23565 [Deltaproteobacteria bacterium]|nr:hypothetical protein [Deltaproteobacteria bacterium]
MADDEISEELAIGPGLVQDAIQVAEKDSRPKSTPRPPPVQTPMPSTPEEEARLAVFEETYALLLQRPGWLPDYKKVAKEAHDLHVSGLTCDDVGERLGILPEKAWKGFRWWCKHRALWMASDVPPTLADLRDSFSDNPKGRTNHYKEIADEVVSLRKGGVPERQIAKRLGVGREAVTKALRWWEEVHSNDPDGGEVPRIPWTKSKTGYTGAIYRQIGEEASRRFKAGESTRSIGRDLSVSHLTVRAAIRWWEEKASG